MRNLVDVPSGILYHRFAVRELFKLVTDEDERAQINVLEKTFRGPITTAINRELNLLRKDHVIQRDLLKSLGQPGTTVVKIGSFVGTYYEI